MIVLNERHLKRLMSQYVLYYHEDRTHLGRKQDSLPAETRRIAPSLQHRRLVMKLRIHLWFQSEPRVMLSSQAGARGSE